MKFVWAFAVGLVITVSSGNAADEMGRIRIITPDPDHTCATHFLTIYEQIDAFVGRAIAVGIGNLSKIYELLKGSGLPEPEAKTYSDAIEAIARDTTITNDVLGELLPFLRRVWTDEGLLAVSVPNRADVAGAAPFTSHYSVNAPFKYVGKYAVNPTYREVPMRPEYPLYDKTTFWNGIVLFPLAYDQAPNQAAAYVPVVSKFFNKAAQLQAEVLLGHLARYVQRGRKAHPELKDFVLAGGKEIDFGFGKVFAETRGVIAEIQAAGHALRLAGCPEGQIPRLVAAHIPGMVTEALKRLRADDVKAQPVLDRLGIAASTFHGDWKRLSEWVEFREK